MIVSWLNLIMFNTEIGSETVEVDANDPHPFPRRVVQEMPSSSLTKITAPFCELEDAGRRQHSNEEVEWRCPGQNRWTTRP